MRWIVEVRSHDDSRAPGENRDEWCLLSLPGLSAETAVRDAMEACGVARTYADQKRQYQITVTPTP